MCHKTNRAGPFLGWERVHHMLNIVFHSGEKVECNELKSFAAFALNLAANTLNIILSRSYRDICILVHQIPNPRTIQQTQSVSQVVWHIFDLF